MGDKVQCPEGIVKPLEEKCHQNQDESECPISKSNMIAISTNCKSDECPSGDNRYAKVCEEEEAKEKFNDHCLNGFECPSSTTTVKFQQCFAKLVSS